MASTQPNVTTQTPADTTAPVTAPVDTTVAPAAPAVDPTPALAPTPDPAPAPAVAPVTAPTPAPAVETQTPAQEPTAVPTPAAETPVVEAPVAPAAETPAAETPAAETPAAETPAAETPAAETPATETPTAENVAPGVVPPIPFPSVDFDGYIAWIKQYGFDAQKEVVRVMEIYTARMAPRAPINDADGANMQFRLYKMLETVLNAVPAEQFTATWNTVLAYFKRHEEASCHPSYINRFAHAWAGAIDHLTALQRLFNLIRLTADHGTRALGLKQVDLDATTSVGFTPTARQRILDFYKKV